MNRLQLYRIALTMLTTMLLVVVFSLWQTEQRLQVTLWQLDASRSLNAEGAKQVRTLSARLKEIEAERKALQEENTDLKAHYEYMDQHRTVGQRIEDPYEWHIVAKSFSDEDAAPGDAATPLARLRDGKPLEIDYAEALHQIARDLYSHFRNTETKQAEYARMSDRGGS